MPIADHPRRPVALSAPAGAFTCPACRITSYHPDLVAEQYCGRCYWWTGVPELAMQRLDLFFRGTP